LGILGLERTIGQEGFFDILDKGKLSVRAVWMVGLPKECGMGLSETKLVLFFLGLIGLCTFALTAGSLVSLGLFWRTCRRLNRFLSHADQAAQEAHRTLATTRQLMTRSDRAAARLEKAIHHGCGVVEDLLGQVDLACEKAQAFWAHRFGNGAHTRSRNGHRRFRWIGQRK